MQYTLLELTQTVLSSMDSDEVSSINDTVESQQVVEVIKTVYDDIISRGDLNTNKTLFNLTASTDGTKPILMTKPEGIERIEWLKYNTMKDDTVIPEWAIMQYLPQDTFIEYMHSYNQAETNISTFVHSTNGFLITFVYRTDTAPQYYTSFNDNEIFFDAYDNTVDSTLQASKTLAYGSKITDFAKQDNFVPDLQPQQFALLLSEAKSLAWAELKQTTHQKAEITARRNWRHLQKTRQEVPNSESLNSGSHNFDKLPNFSRRR